jgi:endonuclease YncB( thermonuclease family)
MNKAARSNSKIPHDRYLGVTNDKIFYRTTTMKAAWSRLLPRHQRIVPFWLIAGIAIAAPWLIAQDSRLGELWRTATNGPATACTASSVYDGDTIRAKCSGEATKLRLHCIDAPEIAQRPWGTESCDALRAMLPAAFTMHAVDRDRYGRTVAVVIDPTDGSEINLALAALGMAAVYPKYCKDGRYYAAQDQARDAGLGIWSRPGDHQRPWDYRRL